jgi:hypothetical protein
MRHSLLSFTFGLMLIPSLLHADREKSATAFIQGKKAYQSGEYREARAYLLKAIKEDPTNKRAQEYLRHVQSAAKHGVRPVNLEARLASVIVRKVKFDHLSVDKALAFLKAKVTESTSGQLKPNFIVKGKSTNKITLDLGDLPASEVLRYIAELSGYQLSYDPHAAVLSSKNSIAAQDQKFKAGPKGRGKN